MQIKWIIITIFFLLSRPITATASPEVDDNGDIFDTFTLYWENDIFSGTDRDYTNGLKMTWSTPFLEDPKDSKLPGWTYSILRHIPFGYDEKSERSLSITLGQNIYTPQDTESYDLVVDDRPYAGHMYLGAAIHTRTDNHKHTWELNLGIVGPDSHADDLQEWLHEQTGSDPANGWDNQLKNEATLDVFFETKRRLLRKRVTTGTGFDLITHLGGRVGNVAIYANTGLEMRYGWHLPDNFGICTIRGGCEIQPAFNGNGHRRKNSLYFFTSAEGRAVAHDIFLDGNTFRDSHHVDKEPLVGDLIVGFIFNIGRITSSYSYIFRTRQFKDHGTSPEYGAISISFSF